MGLAEWVTYLVWRYARLGELSQSYGGPARENMQPSLLYSGIYIECNGGSGSPTYQIDLVNKALVA